ncbi:MAG: hypothetical protein VKK98_00545 [Cyanobacteriota bacterium]|nr:hypothetical protein [Cyanobacteriota bacterium]
MAYPRLVLLLGLAMLTGLPAQAEQVQQPVPLECRLGSGSWTNCTMRVESVGLHWWIQAGPQTIEFRHDGRGGIRMRNGVTTPWRPVVASWSADASLCWDGVCARGSIPLD